MASVDVIKCCLDSIRHISEHVEGAIVYLDAGCTESFQFLGAFSLLVELGALSVCSLENPGSLDRVAVLNHVGKIVVITSRLLSDVHRYILRCLKAHHGVSKCIIFTSVSEMAHSTYPDSPLGPDAFHEYESLLLQDYEELVKKSEITSSQSVATPRHSGAGDTGWSKLSSNEEDLVFQSPPSTKESCEDSPSFRKRVLCPELTLSVHHFPMILCPFSSRFFVMPSEGLVAESYLSVKHEDSVSMGLPPLSTGLTYDGDDVPPGANLTAHFLYHLASKMDLKLDVYSLGDQSKVIGKMLTDMSSLYDVGRRKRSAGLLLVDRTLDLLTPCCHGDSLVDRIFSSLPRRQKNTSYDHLKVSHNQTQHPSCLKYDPLDVKIPVSEVLNEDASTDILRLLESIEAFLCGWDLPNGEAPSLDLTELNVKIHERRKALLSEKELFTGSFVSTENFRGTPYLEALLDRRTKDGAILVKKWVQETMRQENISINVKVRPGAVKRSELLPLVKALASNQTSLMKNKGIIQLAAAILFTLDDTNGSRWDAFVSAEKMLSVSAGDTSQSLAAQMIDIINKSSLVGSSRQKDGKVDHPQGILLFEDALLLTVTGYILAGENFPTASSDGPFSWQEENFLKEAIVEAVLENPSVARLKFLQGLAEGLETNFGKMKTENTKEEELQLDDLDDDGWGKWGEEDEEISDSKDQAFDDMQLKLELRDRVDNLFKFLHKLSSLKRKNIPIKEAALGSESNFTDDPNSSKGLLYKLLTRIFGKYDVPGLEYHSSTVGRLFKSGFGRFGLGLGQAKPSLADQNIILVFVVGGINSVEVREAQEALSESARPDTEMIIGGTTLLTPSNMLELLLGEYSHV